MNPGKNPVTLIAVTSPPSAPGTYTWDFGDGSAVVTGTTNFVTHPYLFPAPAGGYNATLIYTPSTLPFCPASPKKQFLVNLPQCNPPPTTQPPGDGGGGDGGLCGGLRLIAVIAAILGALAISFALCIPPAASYLAWVAAGLLAIAAIAGLIWGIFCPKPCSWGYLFAWQLAIGTGFGELFVTNCCPQFWAIGLGLIAVGGVLLALWIRQCGPRACTVLKEALAALSGVILPLLGWLKVLPFIAPCINPVVDGLKCASVSPGAK
jgi:hypothetical protein